MRTLPKLYFLIPIKPKTPREQWNRHLDGVDKHRCNLCPIALVEHAPLCIEGAKLHRKLMKWEKGTEKY